ncbi:MAG: DUF3794 domain-containing protein, partial [Clostridiales bacterium]|nr:DUF3794 domain-containing protein [Clostridiales bacterium]
AVLDGLQKLCSGQVVAEAKLVPPHGEEITKILGVSAVADVTTTEVFTGEARIKGKVDFRVLYSGAGGERSLDYRAEFTDKITDDAIMGGHPCVIAKVLDTDIVSATDSEIKLAAVVETELFGQVSKRIKYLVNGGDSIYSHESKINYTKVLCEVSGRTDVTAEASVNASKIECVESRVCIGKTIASSNMVVIEGDVVSDVVYSNDSGMGHVLLTTPLSFEVEADGCVSGATVCATAHLEGVKATIVEGEENTILVNYDICANGFVMEERSLQSVLDVFSVRNELNKTTEKIDFAVNKCCVYFEDEADGNVTLEAGLPIVDNIITPLGSSVILSNVYATDGKVIIEGLVRTNVIYFSGESNSCNSVSVELPFSTSKPLDVKEGDIVFASGEVLGITTKIRRGNEIDVRANLRFCANVSEKTELCVITELSEGAEIVAPKGAISMHIASKKETLWDVSKVLCATPETVMEQNPELSFPLSGGERIVCFRKINR